MRIIWYGILSWYGIWDMGYGIWVWGMGYGYKVWGMGYNGVWGMRQILSLAPSEAAGLLLVPMAYGVWVVWSMEYGGLIYGWAPTSA